MPFTEKGYQRRTYDEWLQHDIELAKKLFGDDIDVSETTPLGKYIRLNCEDKRDLSEDIEQVYLSFNYKTAVGTALRRLCANIGLSVSAGEPATHSVVFHGTPGYVILSGTGVSTEDKSATFHTVNNCTIGDDGTVTAIVECDETGEVGNVKNGKINTLVYTNANISEVGDSVITVLGKDGDSDSTVRGKYDKAKKGRGSGSYSSILGAIYQISGVKSAYLEYNKKMVQNGDLPAKSFRLSVLAAESLRYEIAETIFLKEPIGALDVGDECVSVIDEWGRAHDIRFSWTKEKMIFVHVKLLVDSSWTSVSEAEAVSEIVEHINALTNSKTVYLYDIYTALKGITGKINILDLQIGTEAGKYETNDITVKPTEVARCDESCIEIEVQRA